MKAVKIAAAIILSIILLGIQTAALTVKAIENSITAEAISDAFRNAEMYKPEAMPGALVLITGLPFYDEYGGYELTDEAAETLTAALKGGDISEALGSFIEENADKLKIDTDESDEIAKAILETDAAADFIGKYSSELLNTVVYGTASPVMSGDEIISLADSVISQLPADIRERIDAEAVHSYIEEAAPSVSEAFNSAAAKTARLTEGGTTEISGLQLDAGTVKAVRFALSGRLFMILTVVSAILGLLLIGLFIKSKAGFLWWAIVSLLTALPFVSTKFTAAFALRYLPDYNLTALFIKPFIMSFQTCGLYMLGFAAVLIILYVILKLIFKNKKEYVGVD